MPYTESVVGSYCGIFGQYNISQCANTIDTITKLQSGVLCGNITEFGVAEDHLSPHKEGDLPSSKSQ